MRNDSCVFANYCDRYTNNNCQGCSYAKGSLYDKAEELRNQRSNLANAFWISDGCKIGWNPGSNTLRYTYCGEDQQTQKAAGMTIKNVYFNEPVTVVLWEDGTKTIVKCQEGDTYSKETGLAVAIAKKALGNKGNFNEVFKKWIPEYGKDGKQ